MSFSSSLLWLPRPALTWAMGHLLLVLWPVELARLLFDPPWLAVGGIAVFIVYLSLAFVAASGGNRVLAMTLLAAIVCLVVIDGSWDMLVSGLTGALVFAAFLPTVYLLRNVVAEDARVLAYRERVSAAPAEDRPGWMLIGSHVLGAALTVGALAIMSPVLKADADERTRRAAALAAVSGISLSLLWSPLFVAMAVVSEFMTHVPLWQPILLGLGLAFVGLFVALVQLGVRDKRRVVARAIAALRPIIPLVFVATASVVAVRSLSSLSTLEAASLSLLPLALALLALQPGAKRQAVVKTTGQGLGFLGAEISIVALAFTLGAVMRASPSVQPLVDGLLGPGLPVIVLIATIVGGMILAAASGIHPIVAGSVLLAAFTSTNTGLTDLILIGAILLGWACGAMVAVAGLILIIATNMFDISRQDLILGTNMRLVLALAVSGTLILTALNAALTH